MTVAVLAVLAAQFAHMLVTNKFIEWRWLFENAMFTKPVLTGLRGTILLTISSMVLGVALGVGLAIMRLSPNPVLKLTAWSYIWFFRAVPRLVLCVLFGNLGILWNRLEFGLPFDRQIGALFGVDNFELRLFGFDARDLLSGFLAGMLALALSEAAYMAEIVRAGMESVDAGQSEAAQALGLSRGQTLRRVMLPQAMRVIVPPTGNETIAMIKDTSLVAAVPISAEAYYQLRAIGAAAFKVVPVLVGACLWYLALCSVLMVIQYYIERHFSKGYGRAEHAKLRLRGMAAEAGGGGGVV